MYNFVNEALSIEVVNECLYDTSIGYEADFSVNGSVDGWGSYSLVHTYGVWNGFLFGTVYGANAYIGRSSVFAYVSAETHYTVKISMKLNPQSSSSPTTGRLMWRTVSVPSWDSDKTFDFTVYPDNIWHTYILNLGDSQWWQGNVNNLRIYPMLNGADGDEFFIRSIKIDSVATFQCLNQTCSFYSNYSHPCPGIGQRAYCLAQPKESNYFNIVSGVNDELIVNINDYGSEIIKLTSGTNIHGDVLAKDLITKISQVDIGGYAEVNVTYSEAGKFKIYSGTYTDDSSVSIENSSAAETLGFFSGEVNFSSSLVGEDPASGFRPKSSFKIKSFQLLELFDNSEQSYIEFNPFIYNVEAGRRDWAENGLGTSTLFNQPDEGYYQLIYGIVENEDKTIIDFSHPFNASGKIKKIYLVGSIEAEDGGIRTGCKLKILRRNKEGQLKVIHTIDISDRVGGKLYSKTQEYVAVDCDLWVNKDDLLGVYNVDLYVGKSYSEEPDALYFQVSGEASGEFDPGILLGDGNAGFFFYARGDDLQRKLYIDIDLGKRVNVKEIDITGRSESNILEYNIARCLDIDWQVDLFAGTHDTGYWDSWNAQWINYNHANVAYGKDNLTDGIYGNENGLTAESYTASDSAGVVPTDPYYFYVNGDEEWVGVLFHIGQYKSDAYVRNFEDDPVAFTLLFPSNKNKTIFKSIIYFKERHNFRSFGLSYYLGPDNLTGDADNAHFKYIPSYTAASVDDVRHYEGSQHYDKVSAYLFNNPCIGKPQVSDGTITNYDEFMASEIIDWNVLTHEFGPLTCKGFRLYTDYHKSTKINEMELYCYVENEGTGVADSIAIRHSQYEDLWLDATLETNDDGSATAFIGSIPEYFRLEIEPVSTLQLSDLMFTVNTQDVYAGPKGCEYKILLDHTKRGAINQANKIDFKNVYDKAFSLYVDIPDDAEYAKGITFYSKMNNEEAVTNPEIGPGAFFNKKEDYPLVLRNNNCAINCPVYGLQNLINGAPAYWSLEGYYWEDHSTLASGISIDFSNFKTLRRTLINLPILYTNRYWKIGFTCQDQYMNIREARIYEDSTLLGYDGYHDPGVDFTGATSSPAPLLNDESVTGSYYVLEDQSYITFDLGAQKSISKIVLFNDNVTTDYSNTGCGIDKYTKLCIHGDLGVSLTDFIDSSYFEHTVNYNGSPFLTNHLPKFGTGCIEFDGSLNSYLSVPYNNALVFSNKRFTLDFWVRFRSLPSPAVDHCYGLIPYGPADTTDIDNITDGDKNTYFDKPWSSIIVNFGSLKAIDSVYMKHTFGADNFRQWGYTAGGTWEQFAAYGGTGLYDNYRDFETTRYYSAIMLTCPGPRPEKVYEIRAIELDDNSQCVFMKNWAASLPVAHQENTDTTDKGWVFLLRNYAGDIKLEFYAVYWLSGSGWYQQKVSNYWTPSLNTLYHIAFCLSPYNYDHTRGRTYVDGSNLNENFNTTTTSAPVYNSVLPVIIGQNLDGWMDEIRISRDDEYNYDADDATGGARYPMNGFTPFIHAYERFYGMSVYVCDDNNIYGKYCDADVQYEVSDPGVYYYPENSWSSTFYTYFAVDLGQRYSLQLIRNYNGSNLLSCSGIVDYSDDDVDDIDNVVFDGAEDDARWVRFGLLNGDSTDRYIRKLGIYPDITTYISPGGGTYNHGWDSLGTSITTYTPGRNLAFGATVSGSSYFGELYLGKITDGIVGNEITDAWCSDTSSTQWIEISFDGTYSIYRIKMYHGYSEDDSNYLIEDYTIQVSTDGSTYTTIFNITGNTDYEREHVLSSPINASSVKINITGYSTGDAIYLPQGGDDPYDWFKGAVLREVEVNEYYGFEYISSEDYPIIAIDLNDQFKLAGHSLIGIDPEDTSIDWDNSESNFAYADSVLGAPKKIAFTDWAAGYHMHYDKWIAIRRDTATNHNDGPDYLKHAKILASTDPNPVEYYWWWSSGVSALSNNYHMIKNSLRSLKIDYPTGSGIEHIYLIEGDTFGTDEDIAWRDAVSFWLHIDNINSLDDYGYIYFGNANNAEYLEYRWNFSFLKQYMTSGWNNMFLRFKSADDVVYVEDNDVDAPDPRILANREVKSFGMKFRGDPMIIHLDSLKIERNRFMDYAKSDYGLYISGDDYISAPLADFKLTQGTIEFWLRPDYDQTGRDYFKDFKYRSLFHFANVPNDVFGAMIGMGGFVIYAGNLGEEPILLTIDANYWEIDDLFHLGFVYSNDGRAIDTDGSTIRLYFNNYMVGKIYDTWEVSDSKHFKFFIGGKSIHAAKESFECSSVDAVIGDFKIHNYCKTDFSDAVSSVVEGRERLWRPNELIEISKGNNLTYYGVGDPNLPLIYENVPVGDTVSVYVRSSLPETLTGREDREASILASWFVTI